VKLVCATCWIMSNVPDFDGVLGKKCAAHRTQYPTAKEIHQAMQNAPHDGEPYRQARAALAAVGKFRDQ